MIPLRLLTRSVPRSVAQLSARSATRQLCQFRPAAARTQLSWKQISSPRFAAAFHSSSMKRNDNAELSSKLASELETELAERDPDMVPAAVQSFLDSGLFEIQDTPGKQEVILTRKYNDETITVIFNIADVNAMEEDLDEPEDQAFYDEEDQLANDIASNPKGAVPNSRAPGGTLKVAPEDQLSTTDTDDLGEDQFENEQSFDAHTTIIITRPGKGSLQVEAIAREGELMITSFNHFPSEDIALPQTPEKQLLQSEFYGGPPFANLDEELQRLIEFFIEKRGISNDLALFIPEYIDYKEQKEYLNWLSQIKTFVD